MVTMKIGFGDLGEELRALPRRDHQALLRASRNTLAIDGHRWIQWSIRGGGITRPTPTAGKAAKRRKKGLIRQVLKKLKKRKPRLPRSKSPKKPKDDCMRREPPAYRVPVDTGDYANSWKSEPTKTGAVLYSASNPPIKAGVIEKGRRPGKGIPIVPLTAWVRRKLGCKDDAKARAIAIAISWHAKHHGRKGLGVLKRAHPKIVEALIKNIRREMRATHKEAASKYRTLMITEVS